MSEIDRETCECTELHMDAIQRARSAMSSPEQVDKLAELFKVLSDPTRVRILQALHCQRLCVCDIAETLGMTQSAISHQLRALKKRPAGKSPPGRKDRVLLPGRPACQNHSGPGPGAYQ